MRLERKKTDPMSILESGLQFIEVRLASGRLRDDSAVGRGEGGSLPATPASASNSPVCSRVSHALQSRTTEPNDDHKGHPYLHTNIFPMGGHSLPPLSDALALYGWLNSLSDAASVGILSETLLLAPDALSPLLLEPDVQAWLEVSLPVTPVPSLAPNPMAINFTGHVSNLARPASKSCDFGVAPPPTQKLHHWSRPLFERSVLTGSAGREVGDGGGDGGVAGLAGGVPGHRGGANQGPARIGEAFYYCMIS